MAVPMKKLDEIYKDNYLLVYKYLLSITHNEDLSEELTQETFYKAVLNISKFKNKCKLSTWLCTIAKNLWIDEIKKKNRFTQFDNNDVIITEDEFLEKEERLQLFKSIQKLDTLTRDVIYLKIKGDLSYKEIADIMNTNEIFYQKTKTGQELLFTEEKKKSRRI